MGNPHRRVGRVDRLPSRPARPINIDPKIVGVDLDLNVFVFSEHRDGGRARVNAPLALRLGNPLHPMRAALVFQFGPGSFALHHKGHVAVAAVIARLSRQNFKFQTMLFNETLIHPKEIAGPEIGFLAALRPLDFENDVATLVGVTGQQQLFELGFQRLDL